jgi:hypothetical protein
LGYCVFFLKKQSEQLQDQSDFAMMTKKKFRIKKKMCMQYTGVESFRNYEFLHSPWQHYSTHKQFQIKKSKIQHAGQGVFSLQHHKIGDLLFYVEGEPLESWYYHAIDTNYPTGIQFVVPKLGTMIWKCVTNTIGCKINCSKSEQKANVEFVVHHAAVDHESKVIDGDHFIAVVVKKEIQKGEELLVYYGHNFWKWKQEEYCAICLETHSSSKNPMYLCDGRCKLGYHQTCLHQFGYSSPRTKIWFCFNCKQ